jgi:hypothetical protein
MADVSHSTNKAPSSYEDYLRDSELTAIQDKLELMDVGTKMRLAFTGSPSVRRILVRDRNRRVSTAVLQSKLSVEEVEAIAGMRNVDEEVLRIISLNQEWMSHYCILVAVVRNPKTPLTNALQAVPRLMIRDVRALSRDTGVQEGVRNMCMRLVRTKNL